MITVNNYRIPLSRQFTIKPAALKKRSTNSNTKHLTKTLYCVAHNTPDGWRANINTKGLEGYEDITILPFTEKSFELKGRIDVFYKEKDKYNHWIHVMRHSFDAYINPGVTELYCTLCENEVFSGHIVKVNGILQFDLSNYKGGVFEYNHLLTKNNNSKDNEEE